MRFAVKSLGCKVSQADAMLARQRLLEAGHQEVGEDAAELQVVNTCCITSEAEAKSRKAVRRSLKEGAGEVWVSGCAANLDGAQFAQIGSQVRVFRGGADDVAAEMGGCVDLEHDVLAQERGGGAARPEGPVRPGGEARAGGAPPLSASRTRGFVKVQDGCDSSCAYCIIPTVRGAARSRPATAVLDEVARRVREGQPEMVMTGISVGDYRDPEHGLELGELMVEAARVPGVQRVRLSSVEVIHVKDSLVRALRDEPRVCPHLHVPLQSGDDGVLAAMGRHYDSAQYLEAIRRLRAAVPAVNVTADVIVGFPTEDEAAFERTLAFVREARITRVHAFSYSPRPGTAAAALGDQVAPQEKKRRSRELRGLSEALSRRHRAAKLGERVEVLVDKAAESQASGYTRDYVRVYLPPERNPRGAIVQAHVEELYSEGVRAYPV